MAEDNAAKHGTQTRQILCASSNMSRRNVETQLWAVCEQRNVCVRVLDLRTGRD